MAAPTSALQAAGDFVRAFAKAHNLPLVADPKAFESLLDATSYVVRSDISGHPGWTFSRYREILTAAIPDGMTDVVLKASYAMTLELTIVQLTPTDKTGPLTYVDSPSYEAMIANDATPNAKSIAYTIYDGRFFFLYPPPAAGSTYRIAGRRDLLDAGSELPLLFTSFIAYKYLYAIGAPQPKEHKSWSDAADDILAKLKVLDRPPERGTNLEIPVEEAMFALRNG